MLRFVLLAVTLISANGALAQQQPVDCTDPDQAKTSTCLEFPADGVTNFIPLLAPAAGLLGLSAVAATSGGTTSTVSTTD